MAHLAPNVIFNGNCLDAFNFYKSVFGGDFDFVGFYKEMPPEFNMPDDLKEKVMHISLRVGQTYLLGSDSNDMFGLAHPQGKNFCVTIYAKTEEECRQLYNGLSEGGEITMPLDKVFWGALFGMFTDKFGTPWMISYEYPKD